MNRQQGLPKDKTLLAGLAFSVFGLTDVFITLVILMERWTTLPTVQIGVVTCLLSVVVGCGFAAGSVRRRSLIGLALVLSWASLLYAGFYGGYLPLLGGAGLLVCIGLLVSDGVREDRLGIGVHFVQSGELMLMMVVGISAYGIFSETGAIPIWGVWALWGWAGPVLLVGGFALWIIGLTYNSPHLEISSDSL